jgi:hypothetical protein
MFKLFRLYKAILQEIMIYLKYSNLELIQR